MNSLSDSSSASVPVSVSVSVSVSASASSAASVSPSPSSPAALSHLLGLLQLQLQTQLIQPNDSSHSPPSFPTPSSSSSSSSPSLPPLTHDKLLTSSGELDLYLLSQLPGNFSTSTTVEFNKFPPAAIRSAYKRVALSAHPDRLTIPKSNDRMKEFRHAASHAFLALAESYLAWCHEANEGEEQVELDLFSKNAVSLTLSSPVQLSAGGAEKSMQQPQLNSTIAQANSISQQSMGQTQRNNSNNIPAVAGNGPQQPESSVAKRLKSSQSTNNSQLPKKPADEPVAPPNLQFPQLIPGENSIFAHWSRPAFFPPGAQFELEMKIKSRYQLVYHGPDLEYTIPNLQPGTRYLFRLRILSPMQLSGQEITEEQDWTQPVPSVTNGVKPPSDIAHPPVLSNIQLAAAQQKKEKKSKKSQESAEKAKIRKEKEEKKKANNNQQNQLSQLQHNENGENNSNSNDNVIEETSVETDETDESALNAGSDDENPTDEAKKKSAKEKHQPAAAASSSNAGKSTEKKSTSAQLAKQRAIEEEKERRLQEEIEYQKYIIQRRKEIEQEEENRRNLEQKERIERMRVQAKEKEEKEKIIQKATKDNKNSSTGKENSKTATSTAANQKIAANQNSAVSNQIKAKEPVNVNVVKVANDSTRADAAAAKSLAGGVTMLTQIVPIDDEANRKPAANRTATAKKETKAEPHTAVKTPATNAVNNVSNAKIIPPTQSAAQIAQTSAAAQPAAPVASVPVVSSKPVVSSAPVSGNSKSSSAAPLPFSWSSLAAQQPVPLSANSSSSSSIPIHNQPPSQSQLNNSNSNNLSHSSVPLPLAQNSSSMYSSDANSLRSSNLLDAGFSGFHNSLNDSSNLINNNSNNNGSSYMPSSMGAIGLPMMQLLSGFPANNSSQPRSPWQTQSSLSSLQPSMVGNSSPRPPIGSANSKPAVVGWPTGGGLAHEEYSSVDKSSAPLGLIGLQGNEFDPAIGNNSGSRVGWPNGSNSVSSNYLMNSVGDQFNSSAGANAFLRPHQMNSMNSMPSPSSAWGDYSLMNQPLFSSSNIGMSNSVIGLSGLNNSQSNNLNNLNNLNQQQAAMNQINQSHNHNLNLNHNHNNHSNINMHANMHNNNLHSQHSHTDMNSSSSSSLFSSDVDADLDLLELDRAAQTFANFDEANLNELNNNANDRKSNSNGSNVNGNDSSSNNGKSRDVKSSIW